MIGFSFMFRCMRFSACKSNTCKLFVENLENSTWEKMTRNPDTFSGKSRCAFICYNSVSKKRVVLTISRRKLPGMLHLAYIPCNYSAKCGPFQLGAVFVQMCAS